MTAFRRQKITLIITGVVSLFACMFVGYQYYSSVSWERDAIPSIMRRIRKYQNDFQMSMDFSHFHLDDHAHSNNKHHKHSEDSHKRPGKSAKASAVYKEATACLDGTRKQIAKYLQRSSEKEFSADFVPTKRVTPILEPRCTLGLDLIVIVTTRPSGFFNRAAIRAGFGRSNSKINRQVLAKYNFKYMTIFSIGRDKNANVEKLVDGENQHYKDILRLDYSDTYENLTNKTVLTLEWIADHCQPRFVLKTDDDCFVNILSLAPWLLKQDSTSVRYVGRKNEWMPVIRDPWHRNYVPYEAFNEEFYNPYCAGGGYMLAGSVLKNISMKAKQIKQIINEDAYIGMVTHSLGITPKNDERFLPFIFSKRSTNKRPICEWRDNFLMHGVFAERQLIMHWNTIAMAEYTSICDWEIMFVS